MQHTRQTRRQFLRMMGAAGIILPGPAIARLRLFAELSLHDSPFDLGVASGDPLVDRVIIWTRLRLSQRDSTRDLVAAPIETRWEIFEAEAAETPLQQGVGVAWPELGHSVHIDVAGLQPGREYWYQFHCGGHSSPKGRMKTADPDGGHTRFAVVSCNNLEHGYFHAFDLISRDRPDFVFHAGDYIYEDTAKDGLPRRHQGSACITLSDYRRRYEQYRSDPQLQELHRTVPFIGSWDDHEVAGNWAELHDKHGTPVDVFQHRRRAAFQAYYEFMPMRLRRWMSGDPFPLYRAFEFGGGIQFLVLDTRQFRDDQACGEKVAPACAEFLEDERTVLGRAQADWLESRLRQSKRTWTVIGNQVPSYRRTLGDLGEALYSMDKWDGYPAAQRRFHRLLQRYADRSCLVFSGDLHAAYVSELRSTWEDADSAFGTELTVTSVTSGGDGSAHRDTWPSLQQRNPHIQYHNNRRGYIRCDVSPSRVNAEFVTLDRVSVLEAQAQIAATVTLDRGAPRAAISDDGKAWQAWS